MCIRDRVAIGASAELPSSCEVLSYEAPFGVGYLVAQITNQASESAAQDDVAVPALARDAIETCARSATALHPSCSRCGPSRSRAPSSLSVNTRGGELR